VNLDDFVDGNMILKLASVAAYETGVDLKTLNYNFLAKYADLIAAHERKTCVRIAEGLRPSKPEYDQRFYDGCTVVASAIMARGEE
jgi:predicted secreted protein